MSECSGDFYQSHGYFINSAYRGVQLICKLQRLMLSPIIFCASRKREPSLGPVAYCFFDVDVVHLSVSDICRVLWCSTLFDGVSVYLITDD